MSAEPAAAAAKRANRSFRIAGTLRPRCDSSQLRRLSSRVLFWKLRGERTVVEALAVRRVAAAARLVERRGGLLRIVPLAAGDLMVDGLDDRARVRRFFGRVGNRLVLPEGFGLRERLLQERDILGGVLHLRRVDDGEHRSEEHTSELQSRFGIS